MRIEDGIGRQQANRVGGKKILLRVRTVNSLDQLSTFIILPLPSQKTTIAFFAAQTPPLSDLLVSYSSGVVALNPSATKGNAALDVSVRPEM